MFTICAVLAMTSLITAQNRAARIFVPVSSPATDGGRAGVFFSNGSRVEFIPLRTSGRSIKTASR